MAATAIAMPKLGMTMEEGSVVSWPLPLGAPVAKGQVVLVIESEKSEAEIESAASGFLRHIYIEAGADAVPCGALLAAITETADEEFDAEAFAAAHAAAQPPAPSPPSAPPTSSTPPAPSAAPARSAASAARRPVAPAARALARKLGVNVAQVAGSGPGGRVTREDVSAHAEARERLVPVDESVALEVLREGEGPCVLLLPGFGSDVSSFAAQTAALRGHFAVAGVNPRGVGHSDAPPSERYEVKQAAADAAAVLRELDCGPAHIVGASLGAAAAMELALSQPERVRSLALLTPFVSATPRLFAVLEAWQRVAAEAGPAALAQSLAPWLFGESLLDDAAQLARTLRGLAAGLARTPPGTLTRSAAGLAAWSESRRGDLGALGAALAAQNAPLLVLAAGADLLTPDAESLAAQIPGARCTVIPGAGHALASDAPAAVTEALLAHLQAAGGA